MFVYLDNSATTKQYDEVTKAMLQYMEHDFGNPSSLYKLGITAERAIKEARRQVANSLGADGEQIFFTSCGTEADNTALFGVAMSRKRRGNKIITTKVEHPAIIEACKRLEKDGFEIEYIDVDEKCSFNMEQFKKALTKETILVSVMAVNNESGTIMPLADIKSEIDAFNKKNESDILLHSDLVQALGKIKLNMGILDMASVSAHKIHGPKGCGALYVRKGLNIEPYILGGGQERHFRSGTENVAAIVGFGKAAKITTQNFDERVRVMDTARKRLLDGIKAHIKDIKINSIEETDIGLKGGKCCPSVLNVSFLNTRGEVILHTLEQSNIFVSTGSACSSNKKGRSHVLAAMNMSDKEIEGALRFSFSEASTEAEIDYTLEKLIEAVSRFRKLGSFR